MAEQWNSGDNFHTLHLKYNALVTESAQISEDVEKLKEEVGGVNPKMDMENPAGTGSFSMNRPVGQEIPSGSVTLGGYKRVNDFHTEPRSFEVSTNYQKVDIFMNAYEWYSETTKAIGAMITTVNQVTGETSTEYISNDSGKATFTFDYESLIITGTAGSDESIFIGMTEIIPYMEVDEGDGNVSIGISSTAEGASTQALKNYSHAEGYGTIANDEAQHAEGRFNVQDSENKYAVIIGNGSSDSDRSNAFELDWEGNGHFHGAISDSSGKSIAGVDGRVDTIVDVTIPPIKSRVETLTDEYIKNLVPSGGSVPIREVP